MSCLEVLIVVFISLLLGLVAGINLGGKVFIVTFLISMFVISLIWWSFSKLNEGVEVK